MTVKKVIKVTVIILVILCLSCTYVFAEPNEIEDASGEEQESMTEEEKDLDTLKLEKSNLEGEIDQSNTQIEFIENELSSTVLEVAELTQQIYDKQMGIETLTTQEKELLSYIEKAEKELEKSNTRYEKQKNLLEKRLVAMYEMGKTSFLEILLNSKGITEFLSNWYIISEIAESDESLLEKVETEKNYNKKIKDTLETKKNILAASRETIEKDSIALSNMIIIKDKKVKNLTEEELALQQMVEEYQTQIKEIETEIRKLAVANVSESYIGGVMAWPVPGYTRITSQFGMRTHPITGVYKLHTGTDIGAPIGANFIAANDGIVTYAGYNKAYGNMVMIDHGGGIVTLYAHGSEILVHVGDIVTQGSPVLKVGSTGYSTGPHAHFEVRVNGEYVDPLNYITSYENEPVKNNQETNEHENVENTIVELNTSEDNESNISKNTIENE